jgi:hypothetical protein
MTTQVSIEDINRRKPVKSRLTAIKEIARKQIKSGYQVRQILCSCSCGNINTLTPSVIIKGAVLSCGCLLFENIPPNKKYNVCHPKLKGVYYGMIRRCYNSKDVNFKRYGGRGVSVCDEWRENPQSFFDWAKENYKPGLHLDKDSKGLGTLYSPETCRWATHAENQLNTSRSNKVMYKGTMINICQLERLSGISDETLRHRIVDLGLTAEQAVKWTRFQRIKKNPILSYGEFKKKWTKKPLQKSGGGRIWVECEKNIIIDGVGVVVADVFYLPTYDGWENENQRCYFYKDARKVGLRKIPRKKNEWYVVSHYKKPTNA